MTENYNPESKTIIIQKPKNHRDRIIFLNDNLNELVIQYTKESKSKFLLHTSTGKMLDARNLRREIKNICMSMVIIIMYKSRFPLSPLSCL